VNLLLPSLLLDPLKIDTVNDVVCSCCCWSSSVPVLAASVRPLSSLIADVSAVMV